ncbi:unnamed protein product [Linum tenue]|uniref:Cytochrome P450 n=1 Tax=Linum tenue TaxID=586396 RepID=A0AAV0M0J2_9ROSI|nr:unnamed protein product [Linum tenue]
MDSSSSSHLPLPLLLSSFLLITVSSTIFLLLKLWKEVSEQHESAAPPLPLPPGPRKLPIIGNLHNLSGSKLPHHRLLELANAHGPLMHLQLGQLQTIVVSSAETAKQVYRTHDLTFSNRPRLLLVDIIFRNRDLAFAPYGEYWRQLRKLCVLELLSAKRVHSAIVVVREQEVSRLVDDVRCCKRGAAVNISAMIFSLTYRIISRAAFGKPYKELESSFVQLTMEMIEIGSGFGVADVFPSWELLLLVTGVRSRLQKLKRESDRILHSIIEEHRAAAKAGQYTNLPLKTNNCDSFLQELFFAGSETSSTALEWAMSELVRDERVMKKAQDEIRAVFGKRGEVEETGIHELNYLKMVIKESLRLHPPLPLLAPRESREQCELGGYGIPEKTKRFLDATSVDYKGNDFEFIPFGAGRRVCPGISFSISSVETALANLLFHFDWKLPQGMKPESLDMDKLFGATIRRKNDLHLIPTVWQP